MHEPPAGYDDMLGDARRCERLSPYSDLEVEGVGVVRARYPLPNSAAVLGAAYRAKLPPGEKAQQLMRFVRTHVEDAETILDRMMDDELPADTVERIVNRVATWDTARPTLPSSSSR